MSRFKLLFTLVLLGCALGAAQIVACNRTEHTTMTVRLFAPISEMPNLSIQVGVDTSEGTDRVQHLTLDDFMTKEGRGLPSPTFSIPESGTAQISLSIEDDDGVIASGNVKFALQREHKWTVDIFRDVEDPSETCIGCMDAFSIAIPEERQNILNEKIWIIVTASSSEGDRIF